MSGDRQDRGAALLGDVLDAIATGGKRPSWCPGASLGQLDGTSRRMPCSRECETGAGRCGPCGQLERQNRRELAEARRKSALAAAPKRSKRDGLDE